MKEYWAPIRKGAENERCYQYLTDIEPISPKIRTMIRNSKGRPEDWLDINDRQLIQSEKCYPEKAGYFYPKSGGVLVASNVKVPDITGEMIAWWAAWHSLDPLRYAMWDPEDHYDIAVSEYGRNRAMDPNIPVTAKLWGSTHRVLEAFDRDKPQDLTMSFLNPGDVGYDMSLFGTSRSEFILCAQSSMGGKIPVFMTENFCIGEDGVREVRLRFWIGYAIDKRGVGTCRIPAFVKPPEKLMQALMTHNYKEYGHLNKILPVIYEAEKDHWEVIDDSFLKDQKSVSSVVIPEKKKFGLFSEK